MTPYRFAKPEPEGERQTPIDDRRMALREHWVATYALAIIQLIASNAERQRRPICEEARKAVSDGSISEELAARLGAMNRVVEVLQRLQDDFEAQVRAASARKIATNPWYPNRGHD